MPRLALVACFALVVGGCATFDPKHPLVGKTTVDDAHPGYSVWFADGIWHVRMAAGGRPHRFQGSLAGVRGGVVELTTTRPELKDSIALVGEAVQFDVEQREGVDGFDARVAGSCARLDLLLDGKSRPEQVRLGPKALPAKHLPLERCP